MNVVTDQELLQFHHYDASPSTRHVTLSGEADLATATRIQHHLGLLLAPEWITHLELDLTPLRYLDCAALSALLVVRETAVARGQRITVTATSGTARVIALSGAEHVLRASGHLAGPTASITREVTGPHRPPAAVVPGRLVDAGQSDRPASC
ncbi:STAS domain-containing protein [Micromonospora sp. NPDC003816]|uniref:STAS domain-containing protein n=1 Tax=Micromonospora sp. NPDC003816 TaxID=3364224 RepID=UPI0036A15E69